MQRCAAGVGGAVFATDHLDQNVNVIAACQFNGVVFPSITGQINATVLAAGSSGDRGDLDRTASAGSQKVAVLLNDLDDTSTNSAEACYG